MFAMTRPRMLIAVLVGAAVASGLALVAFSPTASANHSWLNDAGLPYHWGHKGSSITLQLDDNLSSNWKPYLKTTSENPKAYVESDNTTHDWTDSTVLDTVIKPSTNTRQCAATSGRVEVCNAKYGKNGWIGLASIWTSGGHIVQGTAKMNDTYSMTEHTKQQVMCQEVGHTFGLGHTSTDGSSQDTCMDYATATATRDKWPNLHDYQQLESIYKAHTDSSDTFSSLSVASKLPASARAVDPADPSQRGRLIDRSPNGRVEIYERDLGQGNKLITRLIRVDESTPAPEGSGPGNSTHDDGHTHDDGEAH